MNNNISEFQSRKKAISNKYLFQFNSNLQKAIKIGRDKMRKSKEGKEIINNINNINNNNINNNSNNYTIFENVNKIPFTYLVQYAREKIEKEFRSPYITTIMSNKNFNFMKEEEKPIYYCLYKINDIFDNKQSRFSINFYEYDIYYNENEYLIKLFTRYEYYVAMKYLLAFVYDKDAYSHFSKNEYRYKTKIVMKRFQYFVNNKYTIQYNENENNIENYTKKISNEDNSNIFLHKQTPPFILKRKNLIYLSEYHKLKIPKIIEYFFRKKPKYFFIKDMPKERIPNAKPNYYSQGYFMLSLINNYAFQKKFDLFGNKKPKVNDNKNKKIKDISSDISNIKKKKKLKQDDDENTSDLSESHSVKFLDEIYGNQNSSSEEGDIIKNVGTKKMKRRVSIVVSKDHKIDAINIEDNNNDIADVEELIKNIDNNKENKIMKKPINISSNNLKKKSKKKIVLKKKSNENQIIKTDNFELYKLYDENANYIQRTFSKKLCNFFFTNKNLAKLSLENINNFSNSINYNPDFLFQNKYFLTSTALRKKNNRNIVRKNTTNFISNITNMKSEYNINKNKKRNFFSTKQINKTLLSIDKLNLKINKKEKSNHNNYINKYVNPNYYQKRNNTYKNLFKSKGKIIKQRKISFSIININKNKIIFKDTSEFISGIKKSFKNKKHQKELIKEIITNFGVVSQKRNKSNKYGMITPNFPELIQYRNNTNNSNNSNKKYKINKSGYSSKNSQISNQKEIFRDYINLNGILNHKKLLYM